MERHGIPTVIVATDTFVQFVRRMAGTQGCPHVAIAETPNPVRGLDPEALRSRVEAMMPAVVAGLTLPPADLEQLGRDAAKARPQPVRASEPV
jgi:hypothetical protein